MKRIGLLLVASLTIIAASPLVAAKQAAMQLPEALAEAQRQPVQGRQGWKRIEKLAFGATRVFDVERSLTKGGDLGVIFYQGSKRRQGFAFTMADADGERWRGEAVTNLQRRILSPDSGATSISLNDKSGFGAHLAPAERPQDIWVLELSERWEQSLQGTLRRNDVVFTVKGTDRLAGTKLRLGETSGYVFEWGSQVLAAVEVINDGAVWIAPDVKPEHREPLLAAIAALLLFENLRATLPG